MSKTYSKVSQSQVLKPKNYKCNWKFQRTWEIVNQIRGKAKRSVKPQFVIDNKLVTTRRTIANEFNKYFVSLASKLDDAVIIENLPPRTFDDFMPTSNLGSMFMSECTQYEVSKIISELKNGKSSDIPKKLQILLAQFWPCILIT